MKQRASIYQDKFMDFDVYNEAYDYICNAIAKQKAKLLEIGCGSGNISKYLLSKRPDFDIIEIDIATKIFELNSEEISTSIQPDGLKS